MHDLNRNEHPVITPAKIHWTEDGQPIATDFDDPYFSLTINEKENGLEETRYVFLEGNQLNERWQTLKETSFVIGETGFGSGLNFIAAWQLWLQTAPAHAHLHFISTELHPFRKEDLIKAAALWPELSFLYQQLIDHYPSLTAGFHLIHFERVHLLLLIGDAQETLQQLLKTNHPKFLNCNQLVDAWFLDGFAPAKNEHLWAPDLFHTLAMLSKPTATAATFTAAGNVRRNLQAVGFTAKKQKGFGRKREMICAHFVEFIETQQKKKPSTPWHLVEHTAELSKKTIIKQVSIIGAGIAGCCVAYTLAEQGFEVTLIDAGNGPAMQASGNKQAVLYSKLSSDTDEFAQFSLASYLYAVRFYKKILQQWPETSIHFCGVLQTNHNKKETLLHQQLENFLSAYPEIAKNISVEKASQLAGISLKNGGLFFPQAGWLQPANVCQQLLQHPRIKAKWNTNIHSIKYNSSLWGLFNEQDEEIHQCPQLVVACGHLWQQFEQTNFLPLKKIRGQVSHIQPSEVSAKLKIVISGDGYLAPAYNKMHSLGATFTPKQFDLTATQEENQFNLQQQLQQTPSLAEQWQNTSIDEGRAHFRTTSPDYLPVCGPIPMVEEMKQHFHKLSKDSNYVVNQSGSYQANLYFIGALGSRGMSYAPLCAEVIASYLTNLPAPLPLPVMKALHPARFIIRDIIKNRIKSGALDKAV